MRNERVTQRFAHLRRLGALAVAAFACVAAYAAVESLSQMTSAARSFGMLSHEAGAAPPPAFPSEQTVASTTHPRDADDAPGALESLEQAQAEQLLAAATNLDPTAPRIDFEQHTEGAADLAAENVPAEPASRRFMGDAATFRTHLETLLESDPETLQQVRALLDEPDAIMRAQNLVLLRETFGLE